MTNVHRIRFSCYNKEGLLLIGQQVCFITGDEKRMKYVDVVIDNKSDNTDNLYTYSAPDSIHVGDRVTVSFARRKKPVDAFVFRINESPNYDISKIKPIVTCDEDRSLNEEMVDTAVRMRRRYGIRESSHQCIDTENHAYSSSARRVVYMTKGAPSIVFYVFYC